MELHPRAAHAETAPTAPRRLSLVIPLYNEAAGVRAMVVELADAFQRAALCYELVLVNNGSTDGTAAALAELAQTVPGVRIVTVERNVGYGWGIISGLRATAGDVVGFMCGDGQVLAEDVVRVFRRLERDGLDLCKVVRVKRGDGVKRRVMTTCYNALFRALFPVADRDINGTPKFMTRRCYEALDLASRDWFIDAEIMIKAARGGVAMAAVDVNFHARTTGMSSVRLITSLQFVVNMLRYRFLGPRESR